MATKLPREFGIEFPIWQHAATHATPEQIRLLARMGFSARSTSISRDPVISLAADKFLNENVEALLSVGFSPKSASVEQRQELLERTAWAHTRYSSSLYQINPDKRAFLKTINAICQGYRREGVAFQAVRSELILAGESGLKLDFSRSRVIAEVLSAGGREEIRCLSDFYGFSTLSLAEKRKLLFDEAVQGRGPSNDDSSAAILLITQYGFPMNGVSFRGETLAMRAAARGDIDLLNYLGPKQISARERDDRGNTIWDYVINSDFNKIPAPNDILYYLSSRHFRDLVAAVGSLISVDTLDADGRTALHIALKDGNIDKIRSILTLSPNLNAATTEGETPLSLSAHRPELYFSLFRRGARAAGRIECNTAKELLTKIDSDAYDDDANPAVSISSHVRFAAPATCFVEK